jgi:hypothetical protein
MVHSVTVNSSSLLDIWCKLLYITRLLLRSPVSWEVKKYFADVVVFENEGIKI